MRLLSALAAIGLLSHCALAAVQFAPLPAALTNSSRHNVPVSPSVTFGTTVPLKYNVLLRTGTKKGATFGQLLTATGKPIYQQTATVSIPGSISSASRPLLAQL